MAAPGAPVRGGTCAPEGALAVAEAIGVGFAPALGLEATGVAFALALVLEATGVGFAPALALEAIGVAFALALAAAATGVALAPGPAAGEAGLPGGATAIGMRCVTVPGTLRPEAASDGVADGCGCTRWVVDDGRGLVPAGTAAYIRWVSDAIGMVGATARLSDSYADLIPRNTSFDNL